MNYPKGLTAAGARNAKRLSALSQAVKEQRRQRGFELKLPQRQYPTTMKGHWGQSWQTFHRFTDNRLVVLANQVVADHLQALGIPPFTGCNRLPIGGCQGDDQMARTMGVELRQNTEDVVQPSDFKRFTQQYALALTLSKF